MKTRRPGTPEYNLIGKNTLLQANNDPGLYEVENIIDHIYTTARGRINTDNELEIEFNNDFVSADFFLDDNNEET